MWPQFVSHKLGRLAVPYALLAVFVTTTVLADLTTGLRAGGVFFAIVLAGQVLFYLLAGAGAILEFAARRRESAVPARRRARPRARQAVREIA